METASGRIKWAVEFCQMDLTALTPGQMLDLHYDLKRLIRSERVPPEWPREDVKAAQQTVHELIHMVVVKNELNETVAAPRTIPIDVQRLVFTPVKNRPPQVTIPDVDRVPLQEAVAFSLATSFTAENYERVRRCPQCERIFFAEHKLQKSCSTKCRERAAGERFRAVHKDTLATKARKRYKTKKTVETGKPQRTATKPPAPAKAHKTAA